MERTYRYEHQRREAAVREAAERTAREQAHRAACGTDRPHHFGEWEYGADYTNETHTCHDCGATETRKVRF